MDLPSRDRSVDPSRYTPGGIAMTSTGFSMSEDSEMDTSPDGGADHPTPTTTNSDSRGGSTSHTSYSPGGQLQQETLQYQASPKSVSNQIPHPHATTTDPNINFFSTTDDMFAASMYSHPGTSTGDSMSNGFMMAQDWDMSALGTEAELPPMSEGSWNQMLASINLGWDAVGPPHGDGLHSFRGR